MNYISIDNIAGDDNGLSVNEKFLASYVELLRDIILSVVPFKKVYIDIIGPIVGTSVGPGTVISFCKGKEVTIEGKE